MPQLDFSTWIGQIFWLIFTFATLYILMTILVLPRMKNISDRREQKISGDIKRAEELNAEVETIISDGNLQLETAQSEADSILSKAIEEANSAVEKQVDTATGKIESRLAEGLKTINKQKSDALKNLDSIVVDVATQTLDSVLSVKDAKKTVETVLKD